MVSMWIVSVTTWGLVSVYREKPMARVEIRWIKVSHERLN